MKIEAGLSKWTWGLLLLLAAVLILANHVGGFVYVGVGSTIVGVICVVIIVKSIINMSFAVLPFPLAALYFVFHNHFGWPPIGFWILLAATVLTSAGLAILLPNKYKKARLLRLGIKDDNTYDKYSQKQVDVDENESYYNISVQFGDIIRYVHSDSLEAVTLNCQFGAIELYLDEATLSPNGCELALQCNFGGIDIYVSKDWRVIENVSSTLGGVDSNGKRKSQLPDDAPKLTISGNVAFGGVDIHYV